MKIITGIDNNNDALNFRLIRHPIIINILATSNNNIPIIIALQILQLNVSLYYPYYKCSHFNSTTFNFIAFIPAHP